MDHFDTICLGVICSFYLLKFNFWFSEQFYSNLYANHLHYAQLCKTHSKLFSECTFCKVEQVIRSQHQLAKHR